MGRRMRDFKRQSPQIAAKMPMLSAERLETLASRPMIGHYQ